MNVSQSRAESGPAFGQTDIVIELSEDSCGALRSLAARLDQAGVTVEEYDIRHGSLGILTREVERIRLQLDEGCGAVVLRYPGTVSETLSRVVGWTVPHLLGEPLVQNAAGHRLIEVFDRGGDASTSAGARYHQTHRGGEIHTDNVNDPSPLSYTIFTCIRDALVGGENILVEGESVHRILRAHAPEALRVLTMPFYWERRGLGDALYEAPVITYDTLGQVHFRYLRSYLESAHDRAGVPLTGRQHWALDALDAVLDSSEVQLRYRLQAGETILLLDSRILHGRTGFVDGYRPPGAPGADDLLRAAQHGRGGRVLHRTWVQRRLSRAGYDVPMVDKSTRQGA